MIRAPVYLVHNPPLGCRGKRRHGEVGIATEIAQQSNFTLEPALPAILARVIQRPVAMNEAEYSPAVLLAK